MARRSQALFAVVVLLVLCPVLRADVIVSTTLSLTNLQILPGSGTLDILSGFGASAFTSVYDSLGGFDQQFNTVTGAATSANSATSMANATAAASALKLTESASSGVDLSPGVDASAGTNAGAPYGALSGFFMITDSSGNPNVTNPVNVTFNALLNISQSLTTDQFGFEATSEVVFNLLLPDIDGNPFLSLDNPLQIGPGGSLSASSTPTLTGTAGMLTNTQYYLYVETDAESFGLNTSVPEPSYGGLSAALLSLFIVFRANRGSRSNLNRTRRG